jgi:hypothetical protein
MSISEFLSPFTGVMAIFKLGLVPEDDELYELTPEQYKHYYATVEDANEHLGEKIYVILPKDPQKYKELTFEGVFTLTEKEVIFMKRAEKLIEEYCKGKKFDNFHEKLCYCASVMPEVFSKGTKYGVVPTSSIK